MPRSDHERIPASAAKGHLHVVIETPRASRCKFKFDPELGAFTLGRVLPAGMSYPYDFGFVPSTLGEDGDPLDVLLLMDEPTFPGCVVEARLIGAIEAWQTEKGRTVRNDRLIAVATEARTFRSVRSLRDVDGDLLDELEHFFVTSGERAGKRVRTRLLRTARAAQGLVSRGTARYDGQRAEPGVSPARGRPRSRRAGSRPRA